MVDFGLGADPLGVRVLTGVLPCAASAQQIPALVEVAFDHRKSSDLLLTTALVAQSVLFFYQPVNIAQYVAVVHRISAFLTPACRIGRQFHRTALVGLPLGRRIPIYPPRLDDHSWPGWISSSASRSQRRAGADSSGSVPARSASSLDLRCLAFISSTISGRW